MAVSVFKTWVAGEVLTAADLNSSFTQITSNGEDLGWPATKAKDLDGQELILDSDADTSITASTDDLIDYRIGGSDATWMGWRDISNAGFLTIDPITHTADASENIALLSMLTTNVLTIPLGTTTLVAGAYFAAPNLTATGTITNTATVYIAGAASEGSNDYALWIDDGQLKVDGDINAGTMTCVGTLTGASGSWTTAGMNLASGDNYQINGAEVLNATTLGALVAASSLTSVGTLSTLTVDNITINAATITSDTGAISFVNENLTTTSTMTAANLRATTDLALASGATVTGIADEDDMTSNSNTLLATQQSIKAYTDDNVFSIKRSARTSNTILGVADRGKHIDVTTSAYTQTFTAAATLLDGWYVYLENSSSGELTLDFNAAETGDGLTSFIMYPGELRIIICDGSNFRCPVLTPFSVTYDSGATWTKPPGYKAFGGVLTSSGASGQRTNNVSTLSVGGAGGGSFPFSILASVFGTTETITIGAGGAEVTGVAVGNVGNNSSIGTILVVAAGTAFDDGGAVEGLENVGTGDRPGFGASTAEATESRATVWGGLSPSDDASQNGGASIWGSACGGSLNASAVVRNPGTTKLGGAGGAASSTSNGTAGTAPGGGGGATQTGTNSGAGAAGRCVIWGVV